MGRTRTHHDLLNAFQQEGCPVCRLVLRGVSAYLSSVSNEGGLTDPDVRDRIRASHGFCNEHSHQWLREQHLLGTAILYEDVLTHLASELKGLQFQRRGLLSGFLGNPFGAHDRSLSALDPHQECSACRSRADLEERVVAALLAGIETAEFREAYANSGSLCLPHLRLALASARDERSFDTLIGIVLARHETLIGQLREIIRRHDYRYSAEPSGEERGAAARAVRHVVGERGLGQW